MNLAFGPWEMPFGIWGNTSSRYALGGLTLVMFLSGDREALHHLVDFPLVLDLHLVEAGNKGDDEH